MWKSKILIICHYETVKIILKDACNSSRGCYTEVFQSIAVTHSIPLIAVLLFISIGGELIVFLNSHKLDLYGLKEDEVEDNEEEDGKKQEEEEEEEDSEEGIPLKTDSLMGSVIA